MSVQGKRSHITWTQRLIGTLVAVSLFICLFPIPVFHAAPIELGKDGSVPFPCQHRTCGCRSAQQCWKQCCCFSNQEKLAWATSHGVTAPEFVQVAAARESATGHGKACCRYDSPDGDQQPAAGLAIDAAGCQGSFWTWAGIPAWVLPVLPPAIPEEGIADQNAIGELKLLSSDLAPPVPPPRLGTLAAFLGSSRPQPVA